MLNNYFKNIFIIIFKHSTKAQTQKLIKCIIVVFSYCIIKYHAQELIARVDSIQTNLAFAKKSYIDLFDSSIPDVRCHLANSLPTLTASHPNQARY
ncbi:unnamed protein product [Rotaria sp. Silwood2]|nr:unnamed protein product [Rotaria sp. Silwood2]